MIKKDTRNRILKKAAILFSQKGYFGVSMQEIANELSITKAALYYHFDSKEALTEELLRESIDNLKRKLSAALKTGDLPSDKLFNVVKTFLDFRIDHPELSLLASLGFVNNKEPSIVQYIQEIRVELTKFIRDIIGGLDFVIKLTYKNIFLITTSLLSVILSPIPNIRSSQVAKEFTKLLLSGAFGDINKKYE